MVVWYHLMLNHTSQPRLYNTINIDLYNPKLRLICNIIVDKCPCKRDRHSRGYGHLPPRDMEIIPFDTVCVDLIGPWHITVNDAEIIFNAITMIDPVTNIFEASRIKRKTSHYIAMKFENEWLTRYPWPRRCVHYRGT